MRLDLVHVVDDALYEDVVAAEHHPSDEAIRSYLEAEIKRAKQDIADCGGESKLEPRLKVLHGRPHECIVDYVEETKPDGLLVGGQGHGGVVERFLGRTAQRVIRHSPCSIYVTREAGAPRLPKSLLVAVDASPHSAHALSLADELARSVGATLDLITAIEAPFIPYLEAPVVASGIATDVEATIATNHEKILAFEKETLGAARSMSQSVVVGQPIRTIVTQAAADKASLIVVGSHGRSGVVRFLLGSVAEGVAGTSSVDVLVARN